MAEAYLVNGTCGNPCSLSAWRVYDRPRQAASHV